MKQKVTILTGAGFTVTPEFGGPSTWQLTNKLRNLKISGYEIAGLNPGEYFYKRLCYHYTRNIKNDCDLSIVNFETIIHLLEEMYSHLTSYNKSNVKNNDLSLVRVSSKFKGVKPSFLILKEKIKKDLEELRTAQNIPHLSEIVRTIYRYFIDSVISELKALNSDELNTGLKGFDENFLNIHLPESKFVRRFYSLNYDTWLNKYLGIYDGFDSKGNFESDKVLTEFDADCHYNLHGSILWLNDINENKVSKLTTPVNYLNYNQNSEHGINREPLIATPIITGYNKLGRINYTPYLQFYYAFQNDILNSDMLIVIGYSFSDTHVNNILSLFKRKCVVVNYIKNWVDSEAEEKRRTLPGHSINYDNVAFDKWDDAAVETLESIFPHNGGFDPSETQISTGFIKSLNLKTRVWWRGIGNDFYNNWPSIIK